MWQWADGKSAFLMNISTGEFSAPLCSYYSVVDNVIHDVACDDDMVGNQTFTREGNFQFYCEFDKVR